ncbi:Thiol-disulfide isomerase or thioredoxin [Nannocystis exedens]|uniref:Thiol-disulfide isomerase or thioredoxin n=2 Tax=Nannocystis exedens TaxID=54 RepID=A0A1I2CHL8_9BACT|nr:Thiol:disulfide interchange protein TlpA [Nannocystis exedens]SFE67642.1 Thiol-disulfide isomerase or thioredoxin [Nannocystis exedens]
MTLMAAALVAGAAGCGPESSGGAAPSRSRVDAVQAAAPVQVDPKAFCEAWHEADAAPALSLPPLSAPPPTASGRSRWINVWATWCKPCIEELPRLAKWRDELRGKADFELVFLSADGDPAAVQTFARAHPEVVGSLELQSADALQPWAAKIGVPGQAVLPIHVFVDGKDRVRCVRTAGIGEDDRTAVEQLLMSL